jgi:hypothetical protein
MSEQATVKAIRSASVQRIVELTIISSQVSSGTADPNNGWCLLKRKCHACGKRFVGGDSISLAIYLEAGEQKSGGFHTSCLRSQPPLQNEGGGK